MSLIINENNGIAFYNNRGDVIKYDDHYYNKLRGYEGKAIDKYITKGRCNLVKEYCNNYYNKYHVLDIGCGTGRFIKEYFKQNNNLEVYGYDVLDKTVEWLKKNDIYIDVYNDFLNNLYAFTFWDSLEHIPNPSILLKKFNVNSYVFVSIPIFKDITKVEKSKHFRPREHLYYFTDKGIKKYFEFYGYTFKDKRDFEIKAGRENIYTYVFKKII